MNIQNFEDVNKTLLEIAKKDSFITKKEVEMNEKLNKIKNGFDDDVKEVRAQKQLLEQDRDFQRRRREFQEDLNARKNEELQQVIQRANKVIKDIAVAENYDFIFQDAVYVNPKHDMTDKVIKALNTPAAK